MKNSKNLMAALLCFVMVISCLYVNVFAAYATVGAGKVSCGSGATVDVPVYISGNSGITNIEVKLSFDSTLLEAVSAKSETAVFTAQNPEVNGNYVSYLAYNTETVTNNGNLFIVTFKAIADEAVNAELKIDVTAANNVVDDVQSQIATSNGSIAIGKAGTTSTETTTKAATTETITESTTKIVVTEPSSETTTKTIVTEPSSETTSKTVTTEITTSHSTSTTKVQEDEDDTETSTKGGKASSKASVKAEKTTSEKQTEETTKSASSPVSTGSVSIVIGHNKITVNGSQKTMDAAAYIQPASSSTMVPLRFVSEAVAGVKGYDATVDWNSKTKTATITYGGNTLSFTSGSDTMIINGNTITMENNVYAEIVDGRMYIPFRALGNALDVNVDWDAKTKTAVYSVK